jgi:hypothetical protein
MNVPIRMIGLATTFFWIFLIAFFGSAAYSAKDLQFGFGDLRTEVTSNNDLLFSLPINIVNRGYYNIGLFNVTTEVSDADGFVITRGSTLLPVIRKGESVTFLHNMTLNVANMLSDGRNYLFDDTELNITEIVSLRIADFIPVQASTNFSVPWGAPLYDFALGSPAYSVVNLTHFRVSVPMSFENHALFDIAGSIQTRMYNNANLQVGEGQTTIDAAQHSPFNGSVEFYTRMADVTTSGRFEVYLQTPLFSYGPLVIPYG